MLAWSEFMSLPTASTMAATPSSTVLPADRNTALSVLFSSFWNTSLNMEGSKGLFPRGNST